MITSETYFGAELVDETIARNAAVLLSRVNTLLARLGDDYKMTSGYRTPLHNARINGAPRSHHMSGKAIDISDNSRELAKACILHQGWLEELGLWCEDPRATKNWVHFQSVPPRSGARFFIPTEEWAKKLTTPLTEAL